MGGDLQQPMAFTGEGGERQQAQAEAAGQSDPKRGLGDAAQRPARAGGRGGHGCKKAARFSGGLGA